MTSTTAFTAMSPAALDALYRHSPVGAIPNGDSKGTLIVAPGSALTQPLASLVEMLVWQGKVFDREQGFLLNKVLPFSTQLVKAQVYEGISWIDGNAAIILDYAKTPFILAQPIRDEIREVAPSIYLGRSFWNRIHILDFVLEFSPKKF